LITAATAALVHVYVTPLTWLYDHYLQLATSAIAFSCLLSVYLYASSFGRGKLVAEGGNSGEDVAQNACASAREVWGVADGT
jgi:hypothetical protein